MDVRFRFATNLLATLAGGGLMLAAFAFAPATAAWIGLGVGTATVVLALAGFAARYRGAGARAVDLMLALAGAWTIVASCVFGPGTAKWLAFADGALVCSLGTLGLIVHEALVERELYAARSWQQPESSVSPFQRTAA